MDLKVLWTISGSMGTAADLSMLKDSEGFNIDVITADMVDKETIGFVLTGKKYILPAGFGDTYIKGVLDICKKENVTTVIPQYDGELEPLSKGLGAFDKEGIKVLVTGDTYGLKVANSKRNLYDFFNSCSFIPSYRCVSDIDEIEKAVYSLGYPRIPVCIKPVLGEGGKGVRIVTEERVDLFNEQGGSIKMSWEMLKCQLERINNIPELLVMEYLPGREYSVDCVCKDGEAFVCIPRQRVETSMGVATVTRVERNDELIEISREIIKRLHLSYNVNIQFKYSQSGAPMLVEVNPRVSGSLVANLGAGVNMLELSLKLAYGMPLGSVNVDWGTRMIRYWEQVFIK